MDRLPQHVSNRGVPLPITNCPSTSVLPRDASFSGQCAEWWERDSVHLVLLQRVCGLCDWNNGHRRASGVLQGLLLSSCQIFGAWACADISLEDSAHTGQEVEEIIIESII